MCIRDSHCNHFTAYTCSTAPRRGPLPKLLWANLLLLLRVAYYSRTNAYEPHNVHKLSISFICYTMERFVFFLSAVSYTTAIFQRNRANRSYDKSIFTTVDHHYTRDRWFTAADKVSSVHQQQRQLDRCGLRTGLLMDSDPPEFEDSRTIRSECDCQVRTRIDCGKKFT